MGAHSSTRCWLPSDSVYCPEAYRLLIKSLEPASKNRSLGLLTMILEWKPFDMKKESIFGQLLRLEEAYMEYKKTGSKLEDTIKFAQDMAPSQCC